MGESQDAFNLPESLTVDNVDAVKQQMINWIQGCENTIKCRGSDTTVMDTAGVQLLLALYKTSARDGKKMVITHPSEELREVFAKTGVMKVLTLEGVG